MNKYIDAEKLIAEIERRKIILDKYDDSFETAACCKQELVWMKDFIDSLQHEQQEVDLEKEIEKYFKGWTETDEGIACHYQYVDLNTCHGIAHHFYELGQREMRHRIMNPEYNAKVVERLKSEYPARKEE